VIEKFPIILCWRSRVSAVVKNLTADTSGSLTKLSGISQSQGQFDMSIYRMIAATNLNLGQIKIAIKISIHI
jgi:hypothetical protein